MIDFKPRKQPAPKTVVGPKSSTGNVATMPDLISIPIPVPISAPAQDRIRERAYELYESRGHEAGQDAQDWLRAEQEILQRVQ
jgi:hypothetical protein